MSRGRPSKNTSSTEARARIPGTASIRKPSPTAQPRTAMTPQPFVKIVSNSLQMKRYRMRHSRPRLPRPCNHPDKGIICSPRASPVISLKQQKHDRPPSTTPIYKNADLPQNSPPSGRFSWSSARKQAEMRLSRVMRLSSRQSGARNISRTGWQSPTIVQAFMQVPATGLLMAAQHFRRQYFSIATARITELSNVSE